MFAIWNKRYILNAAKTITWSSTWWLIKKTNSLNMANRHPAENNEERNKYYVD
jgi:hypothetical protein